MIIAFPNKPSEQGGPGSFQKKFEKYLREKGFRVVYAEDGIIPDIILINGGTRKLFWLLKMKIKGAKIFFRLGGINWLYRKKNISLLKKYTLNFKIFILRIVQKLFADGIIYQSNFSKEWLIKLNQSADIKNNTIIYNGVNLEEFKPSKESKKDISLLCVEGNIDYSPYAIELLNQLQDKLIDNSIYTSIVVYGNFENPENRNKLNSKIDYRGFISHNEIQNIYKNAVYLSLDINAACPNTVIEAMACGIPVIGFDTGALKELVSSDAGEVVPYGSNPWELKFPSVNNLITAANKVIENYETYSRNARKVAEEKFSIQQIGETYLKFLLKEL